MECASYHETGERCLQILNGLCLLELSCAVALETDQRDLDESTRRGSQVISDEVRSPREIWRRVTPPDPNGAREISILWPSSAPTTGHSRRLMHFAPCRILPP